MSVGCLMGLRCLLEAGFFGRDNVRRSFISVSMGSMGSIFEISLLSLVR